MAEVMAWAALWKREAKRAVKAIGLLSFDLEARKALTAELLARAQQAEDATHEVVVSREEILAERDALRAEVERLRGADEEVERFKVLCSKAMAVRDDAQAKALDLHAYAVRVYRAADDLLFYGHDDDAEATRAVLDAAPESVKRAAEAPE